jgi:hypothetical protein
MPGRAVPTVLCVRACLRAAKTAGMIEAVLGIAFVLSIGIAWPR